jgi:hypothetical protein
MKKICLIGPVDKRAIAYPLLKCLMFLGKTLIITDDSVYRRFSETYETRFGFAQSEFIVAPVIDKDVIDHVESVSSTFDYVLYITTNELPVGMDKILYCHGIEKGIATSDVLSVLENIDHTEVYVTFSRVADNTALKIEPSKSIMAYVFECEDRKDFVGTTDGAYSSMLHKFFEKELDVPKATLKGLLQRKG